MISLIAQKRRDLSKARGASNLMSSGACSAGGSRKWDQNRSHRWNQDVQRNEDLRRFTEMTHQLAKVRVSSSTDKKDMLPPPGGHFARLEYLFRQSVASSAKTSTAAVQPVAGTSQNYRQAKVKPIGQSASSGKQC